MREFLRKHLSRRLLALSEGEIAALTAAMRQLGVGSQGEAEALARFHQDCLNGVLCETRQNSLLPKHTAVAGWKHRALSFLEQDGVQPMPKDRGAEQGDVDGPLECSLALGMVAAEARLCVAV